MFSIDKENNIFEKAKIDNAPCSAVTFFERADLVYFNPRRCKKPFENHKKFRTSKSQINCTVNAGTKSGKFVCLDICSYLLPKIFCRVFHLFIFDLQHLFITPGLGQTYSQSLCQQRTEMGVAVFSQ